MFRLLRFVFWSLAFLAFAYFALVVPLGKRTLAGHVLNLWHSSEGRELRDGTLEAATPVIGKMRRGAADLRVDGAAKKP